MNNFPKTIELNDGRAITITRKPKVKDMKQIRRALAGDELKDEFNLTLHMIARVCQIDGNPATVETIEELDLDELPKITDAIFEGN
ncbi:MAG: phage tail assembly protein, partial [Betaproteobacteria bacterium]